MTRVEKGGGKKGGVDKFVFSYLKKKSCLNEKLLRFLLLLFLDSQKKKAFVPHKRTPLHQIKIFVGWQLVTGLELKKKTSHVNILEFSLPSFLSYRTHGSIPIIRENGLANLFCKRPGNLY